MKKTKSEIFHYITHNTTPDKLTRVSMRNGVIHIGRFLLDSFLAEPIENKWVFIQGGSDLRININGDDIRGIKVN